MPSCMNPGTRTARSSSPAVVTTWTLRHKAETIRNAFATGSQLTSERGEESMGQALAYYEASKERRDSPAPAFGIQ